MLGLIETDHGWDGSVPGGRWYWWIEGRGVNVVGIRGKGWI